MNIFLTILLSAFTGTSLMTLFSYFLSYTVFMSFPSCHQLINNSC